MPSEFLWQRPVPETDTKRMVCRNSALHPRLADPGRRSLSLKYFENHGTQPSFELTISLMEIVPTRAFHYFRVPS